MSSIRLPSILTLLSCLTSVNGITSSAMFELVFGNSVKVKCAALGVFGDTAVVISNDITGSCESLSSSFTGPYITGLTYLERTAVRETFEIDDWLFAPEPPYTNIRWSIPGTFTVGSSFEVLFEFPPLKTTWSNVVIWLKGDNLYFAATNYNQNGQIVRVHCKDEIEWRDETVHPVTFYNNIEYSVHFETMETYIRITFSTGSATKIESVSLLGDLNIIDTLRVRSDGKPWIKKLIFTP